jgi:uncharacterized membrane protein
VYNNHRIFLASLLKLPVYQGLKKVIKDKLQFKRRSFISFIRFINVFFCSKSFFENNALSIYHSFQTCINIMRLQTYAWSQYWKKKCFFFFFLTLQPKFFLYWKRIMKKYYTPKFSFRTFAQLPSPTSIIRTILNSIIRQPLFNLLLGILKLLINIKCTNQSINVYS